MANQPLISVIIPVYNVSKYLDDCMDSVIAQSYKNLEIILVDDGSTDGCPQKCDYYASKDMRIKVIHQPNGGMSDARNTALSVCKGEYISFVDSDDVVSNDYIETLYMVLRDNEVELSICNYENFSSEIPPNRTFLLDSTIYNAREAIGIILKGNPFTPSAWGKLYHRRLFQELRFPNGIMIGEDLATVWKAMFQANTVAYTNAVKYYYRQNPSSITQVRFSYRNMDIVKVHEMLLDEIPKFIPDLKYSVRERFGCYAAIQLWRALRCSFPDREALRQLQQSIKQNMRPLLGSTSPLKIKLFGFFVSYDFIFNLLFRLRCRSIAA